MKYADVIVVGLGAMGSAALYQLAKRKSNVLGIDQFVPPHVFGSSHGDTRITRQAIGEGSEYVPLVLRSYELWEQIEKETDKKLLQITGGLIISSLSNASHHGNNFFNQTLASAKKYNIPHSLLDADQLKKQFPQFRFTGDERGYFENNAGYLRPELCIETQLKLARRYGAKIALQEKVVKIIHSKDSVHIKTNKNDYEAGKVILSAGSWIPQLLDPELAKYFTVYRQILYWFAFNGSGTQFEASNFPVWIWEFGLNEKDAMYGFPAINGQSGGLKIATEQYTLLTSPDTVSRDVTKEEIKVMYTDYIKKHINGLNEYCIKSAACLYTVTPDHKFVIDTHPIYPNIIIASPCSGHGFKHSAAIGEILSELATTGSSKLDISKFSFDRFK